MNDVVIGNILGTTVLINQDDEIQIITNPESDMTQYVTDAAIIVSIINDANGNPIYIGKCYSQNGSSVVALQALPIWQISGLTYDGSGNFLTQSWASGGNNQLIFNNYASYIYS